MFFHHLGVERDSTRENLLVIWKAERPSPPLESRYFCSYTSYPEVLPLHPLVSAESIKGLVKNLKDKFFILDFGGNITTIGNSTTKPRHFVDIPVSTEELIEFKNHYNELRNEKLEAERTQELKRYQEGSPLYRWTRDIQSALDQEIYD